MTPTADRLVAEYVERLSRELGDLPRARRRELVEEISEHIEEARAGLPTESEAEIRTLLDRIGDPADIAADARERFGVVRQKPRWLDTLALVLLLVGGLVVPVVGWLIGVALLWISDTWTARDKLIGTLVVPGGLLLPLGLLFVGVDAGSCSSRIDPNSGAQQQVCTGGSSNGMQVAWLIGFALLVLAPLVTAAYLARRAKTRTVAVAV